MFAKTATRRVTISNPTGLHARPSLAIANTVRQFRSKVEIRCGTQTVDAGSILELLSLGATQGTELELAAQGDDAEEVLQAVAQLFDDHFGLDGQTAVRRPG
jgi:phosphotransferase system HPr (HPr) family protein